MISAKRSFTHIERLFVLLIVFILMAISITYYEDFSIKASKVSFYSHLVPLTGNAVVDYAVTGIWPSKNSTPESDNNKHTKIQLDHISSNQGNFVIHYIAGIENNNYAEAYRLVHFDQLEPTLYWVCGYSQARVDEVIMGSNMTNVPNELLNYNCRSKRNSL